MKRIKEKVRDGFSVEKTWQFKKFPLTEEEKLKLERLLGEIYK
ncbi:hypothetical protein [Desulfolucanica intricata]|nr:hypothetical protein [Desulfolucanica intricata]